MDIKSIWLQSLQYPEQTDKYLSSRNLSNTNQVGYLPYLKHEQYNLPSCIVIPVFSISGALTMLECRTIGEHKQYLKLYKHKNRDIPIFNIHNLFKKSSAVVTEGAFNAMAFNQLGFKTKAIATLRASLSNAHMHYLALMFDELIFAFDNDEAGNNNYERAERFYEVYYPDISISNLDYIHNDLNKLINRKGIKGARSILEGQVI